MALAIISANAVSPTTWLKSIMATRPHRPLLDPTYQSQQEDGGKWMVCTRCGEWDFVAGLPHSESAWESYSRRFFCCRPACQNQATSTSSGTRLRGGRGGERGGERGGGRGGGGGEEKFWQSLSFDGWACCDDCGALRRVPRPFPGTRFWNCRLRPWLAASEAVCSSAAKGRSPRSQPASDLLVFSAEPKSHVGRRQTETAAAAAAHQSQHSSFAGAAVARGSKAACTNTKTPRKPPTARTATKATKTISEERRKSAPPSDTSEASDGEEEEEEEEEEESGGSDSSSSEKNTQEEETEEESSEHSDSDVTKEELVKKTTLQRNKQNEVLRTSPISTTVRGSVRPAKHPAGETPSRSRSADEKQPLRKKPRLEMNVDEASEQRKDAEHHHPAVAEALDNVTPKKMEIGHSSVNRSNSTAKDDIIHWVQCDACDKWRQVPRKIPSGIKRWVCRMVPGGKVSCDTPEDLAEAGDIVDANDGGKKAEQEIVDAESGKKGGDLRHPARAKSSSAAPSVRDAGSGELLSAVVSFPSARWQAAQLKAKSLTLW